MLVGIDLGTTKSVIGYWHEGKPRIVKTNGLYSMPSEVSFVNDTISVGKRSKEKEAVYVGGIKRHLGRKSSVKVSKDKSVHPQCIAALLLCQLKKMAIEDMKSIGLPGKIDGAIIAIPSHFDIHQRRATMEAAQIANLPVRRLINEATACALEYTTHNQIKDHLMVIDLGGGTLDISVIDVSQESQGDFFLLDVQNIEGDTNLGGLDFDEAIFNWIKEHKAKDVLNTKELTRQKTDEFKQKITKMKHDLSIHKKTTSHYPIGVLRDDLEIYEPLTLTREEFLEISKPLFDRILALIETSLKEIPENTSFQTLLVGRASRTYGLKSVIEEKINTKCLSNTDPETCVAKGAIIQAAILDGAIKNRDHHFVLEALQDHYGIELDKGIFHPFFQKGRTIPTQATHDFTTVADNQTSLEIKFYKGSSTTTKNNTYMDSVTIPNIRKAPKGTENIKIIFDMDANMELTIRAFDKKYRIKSKNGLSPEEIQSYKTFVNDQFFNA
ncbi:Hsp70 family protein [Kordia algicida OT-1]|uniref:Chaperone protein DnaK (Heat-shock protein Hsp70) n=1 Tax=Kordia algicida OT-1 TaxID=391587 RepID=A9DIE7_9FLAO|nr:Hsp70 family protein [Kordia algicida]EDP97885.1 Chaperone protein DnaK (heat-shock protein Hsp70) [Kordia algicida OT-1]